MNIPNDCTKLLNCNCINCTAFLKNIQCNTNSQDNNFYQETTHYANLESNVIYDQPISSNNICQCSCQQMRMVCNGLVSHINLIDFPISPCTLYLNGTNVIKHDIMI